MSIILPLIWVAQGNANYVASSHSPTYAYGVLLVTSENAKERVF